jgi:hypothetical protein
MENVIQAVEQEASKIGAEVKADAVKVIDAVEGKADAMKKELGIEAKLFVREAQLRIKSLEDKVREVQAEISKTFDSVRQRVIAEAKAIGVDIEHYTLNLETLAYEEIKAGVQELKKL